MLRSICLSVCSMPLAQKWSISGLWLLLNTNRKSRGGSRTHWSALVIIRLRQIVCVQFERRCLWGSLSPMQWLVWMPRVLRKSSRRRRRWLSCRRWLILELRPLFSEIWERRDRSRQHLILAMRHERRQRRWSHQTNLAIGLRTLPVCMSLLVVICLLAQRVSALGHLV